MKANRLVYFSVTAIALVGCEYLNFGNGFDFSQVDDKIEGTKLVAHRQFPNDAKTLIADAKFSCDPNKKSLSFELSSFNQSEKNGGEKLTGSAFILDDESLPEGKIKLGANDALDLSSLLGLSMTSFSNVAKWNIQTARMAIDFANAVQDRNKLLLNELSSMKASNPMLEDFAKRTKSLEESKAKFGTFEKEQLTLAEKSSEDFEKQNYLNKIQLFKEELNIDADEESLSEFKKNNSQDIAKYSDLQTKFNQLQKNVEETYQKMLASDPKANKVIKEMKSQVQSNPFAAIGAAIGMMGGQVLAETSVLQMPIERKKIVELGTGSTSDGELLKKLGNPIAIHYKTKGGEMTFSIDLTDKNLQKVITACQ